jgi:membrane protein YdbS with pleckstrin-like domain
MKKEFKKLEKNAIGCMYLATLVATLIGMGILTGICIYFELFDKKIILNIYVVIAALSVINAAISPIFRYHRYRYSINDTSIETIEGYIFVNHHIIPIERIQNVSISEGPIDRMFSVAEVGIVTGGDDMKISNISKSIAEEMCEILKNKVNDIVIEGRNEDGK